MYLSAVYEGEIQKRLNRSYERLTSERYHLHKVVRNEGNGGWPGDYEGRTFLALVQLWDATGKKPDYFEEVAGAADAVGRRQGLFWPGAQGGGKRRAAAFRQQLVFPFHVPVV